KQKEVKIDNIITQYLNTSLDMQGVFCPIMSQPQASMSNSSLQLNTTTIALLSDNTEEIRFNAIAQKKVAKT
ncbi:12070_t:CDS:2, partial [Dentiscutata erythropus]